MKDDNQQSPQFRRPVRVPLGLRIRFDTDPTCYSSFVSRPQASTKVRFIQTLKLIQTYERKTRSTTKTTSRANRVTDAAHKSPSDSDTESELTKHSEQLPTMLQSPASQTAPICCVDLCERQMGLFELSFCLTRNLAHNPGVLTQVLLQSSPSKAKLSSTTIRLWM